MPSLDFRKATRFIGAIPAGQWTSFKDVATVAGNVKAAQAVGQWLRWRGHEVPHVYRVIRSDGFVPEGFRAAGRGVPADELQARRVLEGEGVQFDSRGR